MIDHAKFADVCTVLKFTVLPDENDSWRSFAQGPDGMRLLAHEGQGKVEISAWARSPDNRSTPLGSIGVSLSRSADAIAKEITRRLIPGALEKLTAARAKWIEQDADAKRLDAIASDLARLPGMRAKIEDRLQSSQRVEFHAYESDIGSIAGSISPEGRVSLQRTNLWAPDAMKQLQGVLAAMWSVKP